MTRTRISQADLAKNPQEVGNRIRHGEVAILESSGQEQVVLVDPVDFRLLQALARCGIAEQERGQEAEEPAVGVLQAYLAGAISLGKAAEFLGFSRFDLQERFSRLGIPLRLGPATLEEARAVVSTRRRSTPTSAQGRGGLFNLGPSAVLPPVVDFGALLCPDLG